MVALRRILDARFSRFEKQGEFPAPADAEATGWLVEKVKGQTNPSSQTVNETVRRVAKVLGYAVCSYVNAQMSEPLRARLERVVVASELQLRAMGGERGGDRPRGDVTSALFKPEEERNHAVMLECSKWIGTAQTAGFLNGAPFNLEPGLGINCAAASQPASGPAGA